MNKHHRFVRMCGLLAGLSLLAGCSRNLSITQADYINTAMHLDRDTKDQTGEPLEVTIVMVRPGDLKPDVNEKLKPESDLTAATWYENRPQLGDESTGGGRRFRLAAKQVLIFTNDERAYGRRIGNALRGAVKDGQATIVRTGVISGEKLAVIYVIPKFVDKEGRVLAIRPAVFNPPDDYSGDIAVRIGVDRNKGAQGQFIEVTSARKWGH